MKFSTLILILTICLSLFAETVIPAGEVSGVWDLEGSPYLIDGDIIIPNESSLVIEPGVDVIFNGFYNLTIYGVINAIGNETEYINFTVADTTNWNNFEADEGKWNGITMIGNGGDQESSNFDFCTFSYSKAEAGGAVRTNFKNVSFQNSTFYRNFSNYDGGAIYTDGYATLRNLIIYENYANEGSGIYLLGGLLENCKIVNNISASASGCAIYAVESMIIGCLIANNNSLGLYYYGDVPTYGILNNTFANNLGRDVHIYAPYMPIGRYAQIENNIFCSSFNDPIILECAYHSISNNIFSGNVQAGLDNSNLAMDEIFIEPTSGNGPDFNALEANWNLINPSLAIDYGDMDGVDYFPEFDIAGNTRIFGESIDIGAYELQIPMEPSALISVNQQHLDFDIATVNTESEIKSFSISNFGSSDLIISSIIASSIFKIRLNDEFVEELENITISPENSIFLDVVMIPTSAVFFSEDIIIHSNDFLNPEVEVHCFGSGTNALVITENIMEDTVWDYPVIKILNSILLDDGVSLTIEAGTKVELDEDVSVFVHGNLYIFGEEDNYVRICSRYNSNNRRGRSFNIAFLEENNYHAFIYYCKFQNLEPFAGAITTNFANIEIENSIFENNISGDMQYYPGVNGRGAALYFRNSNAKITNCLFYSNNCLDVSFEDSPPSGGAIYFLNDENQYDFEIIGSVFHNNNASLGKSIYCKNNSLSVVNCTFDEIMKPIYLVDSNFNLINSIIYNEISMEAENSDLMLSYNDIMNGEESIILDLESSLDWHETNISEDPLWVDASNKNYMLSNDSSCIDAGTLQIDEINLPEFDVLGNLRIYNEQIDIGALEWPGTDFSEEDTIPLTAKISNYPNPFNPTTTINFSIPSEERYVLKIYNSKGQLVKNLFDSKLSAGTHSIIWNGKNNKDQLVGSGVYFYKLSDGEETVAVKKMLLVK